MPKSSSRRKFIQFWLPVIGYCTLIFVQSSFPTPPQLPSFAFSDKLLHLGGYGLLALLFCRAFNSCERWRNRWFVLFLLAVVAATVYGVSDEWHQSFVPGRCSDVADAAADFAGSMIGSGCFLYYRRWRLKSPR
jgi:VanZ family protein